MKDHIELNAGKLTTYDAMRGAIMTYVALRRADDFPLTGRRTVSSVNQVEGQGNKQRNGEEHGYQGEGYGGYGGQ